MGYFFFFPFPSYLYFNSESDECEQPQAVVAVTSCCKLLPLFQACRLLLPSPSFGMQHLCEQSLLGQFPIQMLTIQVLFPIHAYHPDLRQTQKNLTKLVLHVGIKTCAVFHQGRIDLLLTVLQKLSAFYATNICGKK